MSEQTSTGRAMCAEAEDRAERFARLLWECHCAASDGVPVPFDRWLMEGGPDAMPQDVKELREAYDTVSEHEHRLRKAVAEARHYVERCNLIEATDESRRWLLNNSGGQPETRGGTDEIQDGGS